MSWFKKLFGKCCDDCKPCGSDEKQEMDPNIDTETEAPAEPVVDDGSPTVE